MYDDEKCESSNECFALIQIYSFHSSLLYVVQHQRMINNYNFQVWEEIGAKIASQRGIFSKSNSSDNNIKLIPQFNKD